MSVDKMTQAQLDARASLSNMYFLDLDPNLRIKIWKKGRDSVHVTFIKPGTSQCFTIPMDVFKNLLEAQDMLLLASDFIQGFVGFSPENLMHEAEQQQDEEINVS